mgnify:CR=1 FL=1
MEESLQESGQLSQRLGGSAYGTQESPGSFLIGKPSGFLEGVGNVLEAPARGISSLVGAVQRGDENPLASTLQGFAYPSKATQWPEILEKAGLPTPLAGGLGLGMQIGFDPLNAIPIGKGAQVLGKLGKATGGALTKIPGVAAGGRAALEFMRPMTEGAQNLFQPLARAKRTLGKGSENFTQFREGAAELRSAVPREMESYKKSLEELWTPASFEKLGAALKGQAKLPLTVAEVDKSVSGLRAQIAALTHMSGDAAALGKAKNLERTLKQVEGLRDLASSSLDPDARKGYQFLAENYAKIPEARRGRYVEMYRRAIEGTEKIPQKERQKMQEGLTLGAPKPPTHRPVDRVKAKKELAEYTYHELLRVHKEEFTSKLSKLRDADNQPYFWRPQEEIGREIKPTALGNQAVPLLRGKAPEGYVQLPKKQAELFGKGSVYTHETLKKELDDMPYLGTLDKFMTGFVESRFGKFWDRITRNWKAAATGVNVGFHVRNVLTNQWLVYQSEGYAGLKWLGPAIDAIRQGKHGTLVGKGGAKLSYEEIRNILMKSGVHRSGAAVEDIGEVVERALAGKKAGKIEGGLEWIREKGNLFEDHAKTQLFMSAFARTGDVQYALDRARKFLFDYSDLTYFERNYLKRIFPFYAWLRKNAPLQIENLLTMPQRAVVPFKLQESMPFIAGLDKKQREEARRQPVGRWISEQLGAPIRPSEGSTGFQYLTPSFMPFAELADLGHPGRALESRLHPLLSAALSAYSGKESFRDIPFTDESGLPVEVRASPYAAALSKVGLGGALGARKVPGDVRQRLDVQQLERLAPFVAAALPGVGGQLGAIATGSSYLRQGARMISPGPFRGPGDIALRLTGIGMTTRAEPDVAASVEARKASLKSRALASRTKKALGWKP